MPIDRTRFEALLLELSTSLVGIDTSSIHQHIEHALERIVTFLDLDAAFLGELKEGHDGFFTTHSWQRPGVGAEVTELDAKDFSWLIGRVRAGETIQIARLGDFPADAAADRRAFASRGLRSAVVCPVRIGGAVSGVVAFDSIRREWSGSEEVARRLCLLGQTFASALHAGHTGAQLQYEKELAEAIIESLPGLFFVFGEDGRLMRWNRNHEVVIGYSAAELRGQPIKRSSSPSSRRTPSGRSSGPGTVSTHH